MSSHIDPSKYPLRKWKEGLFSQDLIPSMASLNDGLETKFNHLEETRIESLGDLIEALKRIMKLEEFFLQQVIDLYEKKTGKRQIFP